MRSLTRLLRLSLCLSTILLSLSGSTPIKRQQKVIQGSDPVITYSGRVLKDTLSNKTVFDWPGIQISVSFSGEDLSCVIYTKTSEKFNLLINGSIDRILTVDSSDTLYPLIENGDYNSFCSVTLVKRYSSWKSMTEFHGFRIGQDDSIAKIRKKKEHLIEFAGGSISAGFGNMSASTECESVPDSSDVYYAFGPVCARALNADYSVVAVPGKGAARNWAAQGWTSNDNFITYYRRTLRNRREPEWEGYHRSTDAVVISLGTNDFSTYPHPPEAVFIQNYISLISEVINKNPDAFIVCMTFDKQPLKTYIRKAVKRLKREKGAKIRFLKIKNLSMDERGCDWHPNRKGHKRIADTLMRVLNREL